MNQNRQPWRMSAVQRKEKKETIRREGLVLESWRGWKVVFSHPWAHSLISLHFISFLQVIMERWAGRVAVVTGASAGIGAAITKDLLKHGMKVVGLARRVDRVKELTSEVPEATGTLFPVQCDITQEAEIQKAFEWIESNLGAVHVLINNAGLAAIATFEGRVSPARLRQRSTFCYLLLYSKNQNKQGQTNSQKSPSHWISVLERR